MATQLTAPARAGWRREERGREGEGIGLENKFAAGYRHTLRARPWEVCPCAVCRACGIEVVIFRGSNRNRRRGFHNTWAFYSLLQKLLRGEEIPGLESMGVPETERGLFDREGAA